MYQIQLTCDINKKDFIDKIQKATKSMRNGDMINIIYTEKDTEILIKKFGIYKIIIGMRQILYTYYHKLWLIFNLITVQPGRIEISLTKSIYNEMFLEYYHDKLILWAYTGSYMAEICKRLARAEAKEELIILPNEDMRIILFDDLNNKEGPFTFFSTPGQFMVAVDVINHMKNVELKIDERKTALYFSK